ncbi:unnamed protein product [Rhizophagus irregularis]|nr:unnamed protein product [Rhizophagus irregularis]
MLNKIVDEKILPIGWNSSYPPKHNCKIFPLDMKFDNIKEDSNEDLEEQTNLQESNIDEAVSMNEDINNKLVEALKSLRLCQ